MKLTTLWGFIAALFSGCAPVESRVTDGTYRSLASAYLPSAELQIELRSKTAVFVPQMGPSNVLQLTVLARDQWRLGCEGRVLLETFSVVNTVSAGNAALVGAVLQAGCTLGEANPNEVSLEGASGPEVRSTVRFTR